MKYGQLDSVRKYYSIGEVSAMTGIPSYRLRSWEEAIPLLKPLKNRGGKRSYREKDLEMVRQIQRLVSEEGHSLSGALRELLEAKAAPETVSLSLDPGPAAAEDPTKARDLKAKPIQAQDKDLLRSLHEELRETLQKLRPGNKTGMGP